MRFLQLLFLLFLMKPAYSAITTSHGSAYFSPDDHLETHLIRMIEEETRSVYVCIYTFTHRGIINALIEAKKRGVHVEVVVDKFSVKARSPLHRLVEASIPVYVWDPGHVKKKKGHRPLMHNKFFVFSDRKVWTGSFNLTYDAAQMHQENALLIENEALAQAYKTQFSTIKLRSCVPFTSFLMTNPYKRATPKKTYK